MTLNGDVATGTLTFISRNIANGQFQPKPETLRWTIIFTFEAARIQ